MENAKPVMVENSTPPSGPGRLLHQARMDLRLAPEDVAQILHLSPRQIVALEEDDYKNLPGPTYVRGYLRNYAQLLGLSPETVIKSYDSLTIPSRPMSLPKSAPPPQVTSSDRLVKAATAGVAAVVLGLVYMWWRNNEASLDLPAAPPAAVARAPAFGPPALPGATDAPAADARDDAMKTIPPPAPEASDRLPTPASPSSLRSRNESPPSAPPPVKAAPSRAVTMSGMILNVTPGEPPAKTHAQPAPRQTDRAIAGAQQEAAIAPGAARSQLVLHATQESWADIRDAFDNKLLYENIPAGRSITIDGVAPFSVFLGNADGVQVEFNGKNFDVSRYRRGQVARFTLGEETAVNN